MKRVFVIENPVASRTGRRCLESILPVFAAAGWRTEQAATSGPGHATQLAAGAVADGFEIVAVYGGDGTVMQAVDGMRGSTAVLGLIPGGTGNLLAGNLRIPRNPLRAARVIVDGRARTIDLGRLTTPQGERFFSVGCGAGYDADMMAETTHAQKRRWGVGAYVAHALRTAHRIRPSAFTITVDGVGTTVQGSSVIVCNCGEIIPPVLTLGREISMDDGALDVVILNARGILGTALTTWQLLRHGANRRVQRLRGREIVVETATPRAVQADGDVCGSTPVETKIVAGGLTVMTPAGRP